jgi:Flp pilus assembly protein TadG
VRASHAARPHRLDDGERDAGAVVLEFAIIFTLFMAVLWGIIGYGVIFAVQQNLTHAASEGARATLGMELDAAEDAGDDTDGDGLSDVDETAIQNRAIDVVEDSQLNWHTDIRTFSVVGAEVGLCSYDNSLACLTVTILYPWTTEPIVPVLMDVAVPEELRAESTIQLTQGS